MLFYHLSNLTRQKVFVHKNRVSLQVAILYEMIKDLCEQVNKEGPMIKPYHFKSLPAHDYIRLFLHCKPLGPNISDL